MVGFPFFVRCCSGVLPEQPFRASYRDRTNDLLITIQPLYQLS